jgi:hypothetical protein
MLSHLIERITEIIADSRKPKRLAEQPERKLEK